jgi:formate dehydrogenase iron-sulfur subunit
MATAVSLLDVPDTGPSLLALRDGEQYRFRVDMGVCIGCHSCEVACAEQNGLPVEVTWRRVGEIEGGEHPHTRRFNLSLACNHCLEPACMTGCPTEAYVKLDSGIVQHLATECIGCQYCTWNCPYSVPVFHPGRKIVSKCDMCSPRLEAGFTSACVDACPTHAIGIETFDPIAWRDDPSQGDAPNLPDARLTLSTTRIVLPDELARMAPGDTFTPSDHDLHPEHAHWPLVWVTLLTQLAVGGLLAALVVLATGDETTVAARAAAITAVVALPVSLFHLGRPLRAWKAIRGWRTSWLSREVLGFGALAGAGAVAAVVPHALTVGTALAVGVAAVFASGRLYVVPGRPAWHSWHTVAAFLLVAVQAGLAGALGLGVMGASARIAAVVSIAAAAMVYLANLVRLSRRTERAFRGTARLTFDRFGWLLSIRLLAAALAAVAAAAGAGWIALAGVIVASLAERLLFFVTVVPLSVPGSFHAGANR